MLTEYLASIFKERKWLVCYHYHSKRDFLIPSRHRWHIWDAARHWRQLRPHQSFPWKKFFLCVLSIYMQKSKFVPRILHGLTRRRACCFNLPDLSLQCAWFNQATFLKADGQNLSLCPFFSTKFGFGWWVLELTISISTSNGNIVSLVLKERC